MNYENTRVCVYKPRFRLGQKSQEVNFVMGVDTLRNRDTARPSVNQTRLGNEAKSLIKLRTHAPNGSWNTVVDFRQDVCMQESAVMKNPCKLCCNLS